MPDNEMRPDLLYGANAIAEFLGVTRRIVYHQIESGRLPAKKWGRTVCASRREIMETLEQLPVRPCDEKTRHS
jgi:excisionase family DNA binding protein